MLAYNVRLKCDDFEGLEEILKMEAFCWNIVSEFLFVNRSASAKETHEAVYHKIRKMRPEIPAQIIIRAYNSCRAAYKSIKSNKHEISVPCLKKNLSIRLDKRLFPLKVMELKLQLRREGSFFNFLFIKRQRISYQNTHFVTHWFSKKEMSILFLYLLKTLHLKNHKHTNTQVLAWM